MPTAIALVLTLLVALLSPAVGADVAQASTTKTTGHAYYVDCSKKAVGTGSSGSPWSRLDTVNAHGFAAGDSILLKRGTTCTGRLAPTGSGTKGHPIVLDAYGTGSLPTVRGGGTGSWTGAVQLVDQEFWTVRNLHVTNTDGKVLSEAYRSGVMVINDTGKHLHDITIERLTVDSVVSNMSSLYVGPRSFGGISVITQGGLYGGFTDLTVRNNTVSHVGRTGIVVSNNSYPVASDRGVRITGNHVSHVRGDGIILLGSRGGRVDHNVSAYAAEEWPCPQCGGVTRFTASAAIWTGSSDRVLIDHNEAYGTKWLGGDGEGFDVDSFATNTVVEYNYAHDNEGGGILFCGSTNAVARFNVFQNNKKSAIAFIGTAPAKNTKIYNNTLYAKKSLKAGNVRTFNGLKGTGVRFYNNLVINYGQAGWTFPTKVWSRSNTFVGVRGHDEPHGKGDQHGTVDLQKAGAGTIGLATLKGYRPATATGVRVGHVLPKGTHLDFLGKKVSTKRPPRGAFAFAAR
jgi:Right handed beta helix region